MLTGLRLKTIMLKLRHDGDDRWEMIAFKNRSAVTFCAYSI
jgi:hypothetical protein